MLINNELDLNQLIKNIDLNIKPKTIFNPIVIEFLEKLRIEIKKNVNVKEFPDIIALSFFLRKKNILNFNKRYPSNITKIGLGIAFHITPSNMPINFFYSYLFGLISGNVNIVRIPNKDFIQIKILLDILDNIFKIKKYSTIKSMSYFIRYNKDSKFTESISKVCNIRIIWGGDKTIQEIRKYPIQAQTREITFSDKYSVCLLNSNEILSADSNKMKILTNNFYNDGYLIDQNACSSPHLIIWVGKKNISKAKEKFWGNVEKLALLKYDMPEVAVIDKYTKYCIDSINLDLKNKSNKSNILYHIELKTVPKNVSELRGKWGYFYELHSKNINILKDLITNNFQTITYFGFKKEIIKQLIVDNGILGVDRIVPVGYAHVMSEIWDGYDMISSLSKTIDCY